jgi:hypothetical protein
LLIFLLSSSMIIGGFIARLLAVIVFNHCCMLFIATLYIFLRDKRSEPFRKELTKDLSLGRVGTTSWMPVAPTRANHFKASQLQAIQLPSLVPALPMRPYGCQIQ